METNAIRHQGNGTANTWDAETFISMACFPAKIKKSEIFDI